MTQLESYEIKSFLKEYEDEINKYRLKMSLGIVFSPDHIRFIINKHGIIFYLNGVHNISYEDYDIIVNSKT